MTENKPMMIDGIDVKECTCFSNWHTIMTGTGIVYKEIENCCTPQQKPCKDVKNCCFKKLAKQFILKTQECEELKKKINYIRDENIRIKESATDEQLDFLVLNNYIKTLEFKLNQLKTENEKLKKKKEENETFYLKKYTNKDSECLELEHKLKQAEQKLEQIRQIVNKLSLSINWNINKNAYEKLQSIIQIIDEVE